MLIRLLLPAWNMADLFSRTWPRQAQQIYDHVLRTLGADYQPRNRRLDAFGCQIMSQENGESLLQLAQGNDPHLTLTLPLVSDEDVACHMAQRFQAEHSNLLNYITARLAKV